MFVIYGWMYLLTQAELKLVTANAVVIIGCRAPTVTSHSKSLSTCISAILILCKIVIVLCAAGILLLFGAEGLC